MPSSRVKSIYNILERAYEYNKKAKSNMYFNPLQYYNNKKRYILQSIELIDETKSEKVNYRISKEDDTFCIEFNFSGPGFKYKIFRFHLLNLSKEDTMFLEDRIIS